MISQDNFKALLLNLNFQQHGNQLSKQLNNIYLAVDFDKQELLYPEDQGLKINERQTCNFSANENFVVFECVHRLLEKGYEPKHIELEPRWQLGHGASGGRADIQIKDNTGKSLLIIECKTFGKEFDKAWEKTQKDGGQLFSYLQQEQDTEFLCLYASDFNNELIYKNYLIPTNDIKNLVEKYADDDKDKPLFYKDANNVKELYQAWLTTYGKKSYELGLFETNISAYRIGQEKITAKDLKIIQQQEIQKKYNEFATILRTYNVSSKETAFDKLINLFLCKIVDETQSHKNDTELSFYWRGEHFDDYFSLIDRLQVLYKEGMKEYLGEDITYINDNMIDEAFWAVKHDRNATKKKIKQYFTELKFFTNNDFGFIDVHNRKLFYQNALILLDIVRMWQNIRLNGDEQHQFLGDMFEFFLDKGFKQSEGQFFTSIPICRFILQSLPLEDMINTHAKPPQLIDYACGAGHFLTEYAAQIKPIIENDADKNISDYYQAIFGVEKEYRLSKVAKISTFMYGQGDINVIYCDALDDIQQQKKDKVILAEKESFDILVANPPFAVEGFLKNLPNEQRRTYSLLETVADEEHNRNIQCFFLERAKQLLSPNGIAAIIVPSSVLSNTDSTHIGAREILLKYFDIVAIVELGNGTFGKTGTNTVILFLRRKYKQPTEAEQYFNRVEDWFSHDEENDIYQDDYIIKQYCQHIAVDFADYTTLLNGKPSDELLKYELFAEYQADFNNSTTTKNLVVKHHKQLNNLSKSLTVELAKQHPTKTPKELVDEVLKQLPAAQAQLKIEQQAELNAKFLEYLRDIEKHKLFYFAMAVHNPQKVLIVKSPTDGKEQKSFLGYEWSAAKGNEGIKLTTDKDGKHITLLYDADNRNNPEKISYWIAKNFLNAEMNFADSEDLNGFIGTARLIDMLDFSLKDFNKTISLATKKSLEIKTKWELVKLEKLNSMLKRGKSTQYGNSQIQVIKSGQARGYKSFDFSEKYYAIESFISDERNLQKGDLLINSTGVGTAGRVTLFDLDGYFIADSHIAIFRPNETINSLYLLCVLSYLIGYKEIENMAQGATGQIELTISTIENIKIPLPPKDIQQQIVADCEAIDKAVQDAEQTINNAWKEIDDRIDVILAENYPIKKLSSVIEIIGGGTPSTKNSEFWNGNIPWLSVVDFNNEQRFVSTSEKSISELGLKNSSTKYLNIGDLIISARGTVGALAQLAIPMTFNQSCYGLRGNQEVDNGFLYYILKREIKQFKDNAYGSKFDAITTKTFDSIKIPIPPIDIQKKMVSNIESIEKIIVDAQAIINNAPAQKQAILKKYL